MPPEDNKGNQGTQSLEGLTKAFGDMSKAFGALPGQVAKAVEQGINTAVQQQQAAAQRQTQDKKPVKQEPPKVSGNDLEKMSREEFARHILDTVTAGIEDKLTPFQESVSALSEMTHRDRLMTAFSGAKQKYKDFDQWKDEMAALVEKTGLTDPDDLYTLARNKNPDKAKQIDEEMKKADETNKDTKGSEDKQALPRFLGLMPTNSPPGERSDAPQFKNAKEAATAAFDELMKDIPAEFIGEASQV